MEVAFFILLKIVEIFTIIFLLSVTQFPIRQTLHRLLIVNIFIFFIWLFIPFSVEGWRLISIGPFVATREGVELALKITIKSNLILIAIAAFFTTMPVFTLGRAMRHLRMPGKIVNLLLFTFRYIHVILKEFDRLTNAIKIRGFQPGTNIHTYKTYAFLAGMLFVRSYDRAERVHNAMLCRGFHECFYDLSEFSLKITDVVFLVLMSFIIASIGLLEWTRIIY